MPSLTSLWQHRGKSRFKTSCQIFNSCWKVASGSWKHHFHRLKEWNWNEPMLINPPPEMTWKGILFNQTSGLTFSLANFVCISPPSSRCPPLCTTCSRICVSDRCQTSAHCLLKKHEQPQGVQELFLPPKVRRIISKCRCSAFQGSSVPLAALFDGQMSCEGKSRSGIWEAQVPPDGQPVFSYTSPPQPTTAHQTSQSFPTSPSLQGLQSDTRASWKATDTENKVLSWELPAFFFPSVTIGLGFSPSPRCWFWQYLKEILC